MINVARELFTQAERHKWIITVMYDEEPGYDGKNAAEAWRAVTDVSDDVRYTFFQRFFFSIFLFFKR